MNKASGNEMQIAHFYDFYYLEAMKAGLTMAKSANPEIEYRHSVERLERDLETEYARLSKSIALRVYVYLWAAALGEARHASGRVGAYISETKGSSRDSVFYHSLEYFPDEHNTNALLDVLGSKGWSSSYGGKKWYEIVQGMMLYGKISDAAFIDHAVDLEHNGGCVFDKFSGKDVILFNCEGYRYLHSFLDYKFRHNILTDAMNPYSKFQVSLRTYNLVARYQNIIGGCATNWLVPELETLSDYSVDWDVRHLTVDGCVRLAYYATHHSEYVNPTQVISQNHKHHERRERRRHTRCVECGCRVSDDYSFYGPDDCTYCESCYDDKFTSCEKCGETLENDEIIHVENEGYYCEYCAKNKVNAVPCWACNEWHVIDEMTMCEDSTDCYCENCKGDYVEWECSECGASHEYAETENCENCGHPQHDERREERKESEYENWQDGDGVLSNHNATDDILTVKDNITIKSNGKDETVFVSHYTLEGTPLKLVDLNVVERITGHPKKGERWVVLTSFTLWADLSQDYEEAVTKFRKVVIATDWNKIKTAKEWEQIGETEREKVRQACHS